MVDAIVLSYGDCLLRVRDMTLLKSPNWLNDALIGFAFDFLFNQISHDFRSSICMIAPEVTQFIKLSSSGDGGEDIPLELFLEPLKLEEKNFVFLAINDQEDSESAGGNHWSLLVYARNIDAFVHFDSASYNRSDADRVARKVAPFLSSSNSFSSPRFIESSLAAKQTNSFDCGMFLITHAETILERLTPSSRCSSASSSSASTISSECDVSALDLKALVRQSDMETNREKWQERIKKLSTS